MSELKAALEAADIQISKYDPVKTRPVFTNLGTMDVRKFGKILLEKLGVDIIQHAEVLKAAHKPGELEKMLERHVEAEGLSAKDSKTFIIPDELKGYTLNIDQTSKEEGSKRFFLTTEDDFISVKVSGKYYLDKCRIALPDGVELARPVTPKYMPRRPPGITIGENQTTQEKINFLNTYIPPEWALWRMRNPADWKRLSDKPPALIMKLLQHLVPLKEEREYLYAWIYTSMVSRSYVYLVLSGVPGSGKNRLKLLFNALHGNQNYADGKKETFGANGNQFNGQMEESTLAWFDELKYDMNMEPRMKEYQNDFISIEKKGVDSTRSTEIFTSMVISNNYPRHNYLLFDSRKFAPLVLAKQKLEFGMTSEEINELSERLDVSKPTYDVKFVAQIAKWILRVGSKNYMKWPNLEYKGPKFWELAHASMAGWQKIAVLAVSGNASARGPFPGWDEQKGAYLWSKVEAGLRRKKEYESKDHRDATTVKAFFDSFRDEKGRKVFETESAGKTETAFFDFWIKQVGEVSKTEVEILKRRVSDIDSDDKPNLFVDSEKKLVRPPGTSEFQWRKMKSEHEAMMKGKDNGKKERSKETDDL